MLRSEVVGQKIFVPITQHSAHAGRIGYVKEVVQNICVCRTKPIGTGKCEYFLVEIEKVVMYKDLN